MTYLNIISTMISVTYSFPAKPSSLRLRIVGFTPATHGLILGVGVVDMVCRPWAIGIAHGLCVPCQTHWLLIHLGRRQVKQLPTVNLVPGVATLNRNTVKWVLRYVKILIKPLRGTT